MLSTQDDMQPNLTLAGFEELARDLVGSDDTDDALHDLVVVWLEGSRLLHDEQHLKRLIYSYRSQARRKEKNLKDREKRAGSDRSPY